MKNKEGVELSLNVIVVAVIVLIVLVISIMIYKNKMGENVTIIDGVIVDMNGDCDGDKISNLFDKCPCDPGENEYSGCPMKFGDIKEKIEQLPCSTCVND